MKNTLVSDLFDTRALRICEPDKPFWYTSNKIGPYYINTHFLYGSEDKAVDLLNVIDTAKNDPDGCSSAVFEKVRENYDNDPIFRSLIDTMVSYIRSEIPADSYQMISGGERRDWFFSLIIADILGLPHITIFKTGDMRVFDTKTGELKDLNVIKGKKVLHIADLITEASSYERAWIPFIKEQGGVMTHSLVVVDRDQGGRELLEKNNVTSHALVTIDKDLFDAALEKGYIDQSQYEMVTAFLGNAFESMRDFLLTHPDYLDETIAAGGKNAERARLCKENDLYKLVK